MVKNSGLRYTLDVAHLVGDVVIRRHITRLTADEAIDLEHAERIMPGTVHTERSMHVWGDKSWTIQYPNRDLGMSERMAWAAAS